MLLALPMTSIWRRDIRPAVYKRGAPWLRGAHAPEVAQKEVRLEYGIRQMKYRQRQHAELFARERVTCVHGATCGTASACLSLCCEQPGFGVCTLLVCSLHFTCGAACSFRP